MVTLAQIADNKGARKPRTRVGRGIGSGKGKTAGRGHKGQKSRSGVSTLGLEGGQTPIFMRIPKRGFNNIHAKDVEIINITTLADFAERKRIDASKKITRKELMTAGLIKRETSFIKILGKAKELKTKLTIEANRASKNAISLIEKAGGKVEIVELKTTKTETAKKTPAKKAEEKK